MKSTICVAVVAALAVGLRFVVMPSAAAKDEGGKIRVSVEELGKTADLIGRLGKPLGTWVTIKGKWALPKEIVKDFSLRFTVTHVDGAKLAKPIEFHVAQVHAVDQRGKSVTPEFKNRNEFNGRTWTLTAYETGEFHVTPPEYYKAIGIEPGSVQEPPWTRPITPEIHGVLQPE
jgi:hypothetical protein